MINVLLLRIELHRENVGFDDNIRHLSVCVLGENTNLSCKNTTLTTVNNEPRIEK